MIEGYLHEGWPEPAQDWLLQMVDAGLKPCDSLCFAVVRALAPGNSHAAERVVKHLELADVKLSTRIFTQLAAYHSKRGDFAKVESILEWLYDVELKVDARFFHSLLLSYANGHGDPARADAMAQSVLDAAGDAYWCVDKVVLQSLERALGRERCDALKEERKLSRYGIRDLAPPRPTTR